MLFRSVSWLRALKWADFVHFYTLGDIARTQSTALLYDAALQHARQVALVPESIADVFIPVYPPQTALLFAPLSLLPYLPAGLIWVLVTVAAYGWAVWLAWRPAQERLPDRTFLVAAALAFPPVWQLAAYGQTSAVVIVAFAVGWWALERGHTVLAGAALSILTIKPQFGLVVAAVAILSIEGRLIVGVLIGTALQALSVLAAFDRSVFITYWGVVGRIPTLTAVLEPEASKMHSIRALTRLFGPRVDPALWAIASAAVVAATIWVWRQRQPWRLRFGLLVLASALVNPHLTIYDVTVIALPIVWIGGWLLEQQTDVSWYWHRVYLIALTLFIPTATLVNVQLSTILMAELFVKVARVATNNRTMARESS